ncbi:CBS domain-containing protein [Devosia algicola]|uniref:CBS domain-containing protein n=1 Tax=Devosia algicola TaxID=3026418 RepID=A0ABY7YLW3_9HYPH|nr:CBS domain-containing protein [Devosia algicola]WDR02080.1 CBS domain-containing protein [Devosia algicola]
MSPNQLRVAYADEYLDSVADRLSEANIAHLPVVSPDDHTLVGYLGWKDLMRANTRLNEEESNRISFLPGKDAKPGRAGG